MTALYTAHAVVSGGRDGKGRTDDGKIDVTLHTPKEMGGLHTPKEMGGKGGDGTNPEQLFAVGYAACFTGAMKAMAHKLKLTLPADMSLASHVTFHKEESGYSLSTELVGTFPGMAKDAAEGLMKAAHEVCPYSKATRGNMPVKLTVAS